ncbi:MAG: cyanophycin synthetase [candidate division WOR-3 bacterium]
MMEAISFLNSLLNYEQTGGYTKSLEPFLELLEKLGRPHESKGKKILIVGTKGKGSVAAHITRGALSAGYTIGTYISPHLVDLTERISLNGRPISKDELFRLISEVKPHILGRRGMATWFEAMTAAAFLCFRDRKPDLWVLEAGLGGRLDATNAVSQDITIITRIGLDHTHILGKSVSQIAREKADVVKGGIVITCNQEREATEVIAAICEERGAELIIPEYRVLSSDLSGTRILMAGREYWTPLPGRFQAENLAISVAGLLALGIENPDFSGTEHPGRFQVIQGKVPMVLDGAHNALALSEILSETRRLFPGRDLLVVFGASRGKDTEAMLRLLVGARLVILTRAQTPRAAEPFLLEPAAKALGLRYIRTRGVAEALERSKALATEGDVILITGSLYVVGEVMRIMLT